MPRTRSIKPEFWSDEKLARVSRESRLLFVGLWNCSDDYGVTKGHPVWLKSQLFPYDDDLKLTTFTKWLAELEKHNFIIPFSYDGEKFYYIKHFTEHQKVDHPSKQRNPEPPSSIINMDSRDILEDSREFRVETDTDTETETETETEGGVGETISPERASPPKKDFLESIKSNPAFSHVDFETELSKMDAWLMLPKNKGRKKTPRFVLTWISKIEKPIDSGGNGKGKSPPHPDFIIDQGLRGKDSHGVWWIQKHGEWIVEQEA